MNILSIEISNSKLQTCGEGPPQKVRNIGIDNPAQLRHCMPERVECPDERAHYQQDVDRGQEIILEPKLYRSEGEVEEQVECKRQSHHPRNLFGESFVENCAKGNSDDGIKHRPHWAEEP